jgi:hypothetical protein
LQKAKKILKNLFHHNFLSVLEKEGENSFWFDVLKCKNKSIIDSDALINPI